MQYALVTGANKGIGFEIAHQLGEKGFHIFLSARNLEKGEAASDKLKRKGISVECIQMDVSDLKSIESGFEKVKSKTKQLDVLINNAGILLKDDRDLLTVSNETILQTLHTNALGVLWVTRIFSPLLKAGSRVINISSGGGAICGGISTWSPVYCISKTSENAITLQLAHALQGKGVTVNAVCPGWVRTDMGGQGASRSIEKGAETPVWLATDPKMNQTGKFFRDKSVISW